MSVRSVRARRRLLDAAPPVFAGVEAVATRNWGPDWMLGCALLVAVLLVVRRRFPRTVLLLTLPGLAAGYLWLPVMFALYAVAALPRQRGEPWVWGAVVSGVSFYPWPHLELLPWSWEDITLDALSAVLLGLAPVALGLLSTSRRELAAKAAELALSRQRERELAGERATAAERARIAREMHDTVAHHLSLIALTCDSGDPDRVFRRRAEAALDELRRTVAGLRAPGLPELRALIEAAGSEVTPHGDLDRLARWPLPVQEMAYRLVQEGLTNARKHAPGAPVRLVVEYDPVVECDRAVEYDPAVPNDPAVERGPYGGETAAALRITVCNGRPRITPGPGPGLPSGKYGLVGLRERVVELRGALQAGPEPDGGFRVSATLPRDMGHVRREERGRGQGSLRRAVSEPSRVADVSGTSHDAIRVGRFLPAR
ncbi:histidine kinase [Streptomyces sp. A3M-1-3]|uniref:sensor histidine kinase n=1 Tax=Streptomyces sp. A3M-1-3 TaxID=2962044 RepID=UPI0020B7C6FE|nr:histidine kinase [Streptomyces sp. A3M-1-3]MCP3817909.1 histidine kinase [Streptomyces sp. A3M-1-3]